MRVVHTEAALITPCRPRARKPAPPSATDRCTWRSSWRTRATWRSRCWPTRTATPSTWASATAPCSAATRRSSRKRRPRHSPPLIAKIGERCADACRKIGYRGAGTFEFLYENGEFYFIEMNTRVQVGTRSPRWSRASTSCRADPHRRRRSCRSPTPDIERGHAIECRINAEDPVQVHPVAGPHHDVARPGGPGIRVDSHAYTNYFVPPNYDSMIGKVIAYGDSREQMARMRVALSRWWSKASTPTSRCTAS